MGIDHIRQGVHFQNTPVIPAKRCANILAPNINACDIDMQRRCRLDRHLQAKRMSLRRPVGHHFTDFPR
ncbi:hypothetical protein D3C84_1241320 [compost metagenome]